MDAQVDVITLGVDDLEASAKFYRDGLGLETEGIIATDLFDEKSGAAGAVAMFKLNGGLILALYPRADLAKEGSVSLGPPKSGEFSLGHLVETREDVDRVLKEAESAGATITEPPRERPWGIYSGYFRDLDGHLWEIICNHQTATRD